MGESSNGTPCLFRYSPLSGVFCPAANCSQRPRESTALANIAKSGPGQTTLDPKARLCEGR